MSTTRAHPPVILVRQDTFPSTSVQEGIVIKLIEQSAFRSLVSCWLVLIFYLLSLTVCRLIGLSESEIKAADIIALYNNWKIKSGLVVDFLLWKDALRLFNMMRPATLLLFLFKVIHIFFMISVKVIL